MATDTISRQSFSCYNTISGTKDSINGRESEREREREIWGEGKYKLQ